MIKKQGLWAYLPEVIFLFVCSPTVEEVQDDIPPWKAWSWLKKEDLL